MGLLPVRYVRLDDLDHVSKSFPVWIDHRAVELVEQQPRGLVADDTELGLQLERRHAVRMRRDEIGRQEPLPWRQVRAVHYGSGDQGGLVAAARPLPLAVPIDVDALTLPDPRPRLQPLGAVAAALEAFEPVPPPFRRQVFSARKIVGEVRSEFLQRRRAILGPAWRKQAFAHAARIIEQGKHVMRERYLWLTPVRRG